MAWLSSGFILGICILAYVVPFHASRTKVSLATSAEDEGQTLHDLNDVLSGSKAFKEWSFKDIGRCCCDKTKKDSWKEIGKQVLARAAGTERKHFGRCGLFNIKSNCGSVQPRGPGTAIPWAKYKMHSHEHTVDGKCDLAASDVRRVVQFFRDQDEPEMLYDLREVMSNTRGSEAFQKEGLQLFGRCCCDKATFGGIFATSHLGKRPHSGRCGVFDVDKCGDVPVGYHGYALWASDGLHHGVGKCELAESDLLPILNYFNGDGWADSWLANHEQPKIPGLEHNITIRNAKKYYLVLGGGASVSGFYEGYQDDKSFWNLQKDAKLTFFEAAIGDIEDRWKWKVERGSAPVQGDHIGQKHCFADGEMIAEDEGLAKLVSDEYLWTDSVHSPLPRMRVVDITHKIQPEKPNSAITITGSGIPNVDGTYLGNTDDAFYVKGDKLNTGSDMNAHSFLWFDEAVHKWVVLRITRQWQDWKIMMESDKAPRDRSFRVKWFDRREDTHPSIRGIEVDMDLDINDLDRGKDQELAWNWRTKYAGKILPFAHNFRSLWSRHDYVMAPGECFGDPHPRLTDCTEDDGVWGPACSANAVQLAVAKAVGIHVWREMGPQGSWQSIPPTEMNSTVATALKVAAANWTEDPRFEACVEGSHGTNMMTVVEQKPFSTELRQALMKFGLGLNVTTVASPTESEDWRMIDAKGAGGASPSELFRSKNGAIWLKTMTPKELAVWKRGRDSYEQRVLDSAEGGVPQTFLSRQLGVFEVKRGRSSGRSQFWLAMLDITPNGATPISKGLMCDVKPHQLSAVPDSYRGLDECGKLFHRRPISDDDAHREALVKLMRTAQRDLCWLHSQSVIDYSWFFARALDGAIGAVQVKGTWWYVGLIDHLLDYKLLRYVENVWRAISRTDELPKDYENRVWADPAMYKSKKFDDYAAKQFGMFKAFVHEESDIRKTQLVCNSARALQFVDIEGSVEHHDLGPNAQVPFIPVARGLGSKYAEQRLEQCKNSVKEEKNRLYEQVRSKLTKSISDKTGEPEIVRPSQDEILSSNVLVSFFETLQRQPLKRMTKLECIWTASQSSNGENHVEGGIIQRGWCHPNMSDMWIRDGCIKLLEPSSE